MITTEKLKKLNILISTVCMIYIIILLIINHYCPPVRLVYFYATIPFIIFLYIIKIIVIKRNRIDAKFTIKLSPEQYKRVAEIANNQDKSVNQFCVDIIDEKLNEKSSVK